MAGRPWGHYFSCIALAVIVVGCAKTVSPPGGPVDTIPPEIMTASPATGAVNVPSDSRIEIIFSERIDPRSVDRALFITPQLKPEPKIKAGGTKIVIIPQEPLKPDRTYVITLGTDLRDAHNVKLAQSINIAFATGPTLDTGSISGTVYDANFKPAPNVSIALFEDKPNVESGPIDSLNPDYITQSGAGGLFAFKYIPPKEYYLVAFDDLNKNHFINPDRERFGLPSRSVIIDSETPILSGVKVALKNPEQSILSVRSAAINANGLLKIRFSNPVSEKDAALLFSSFSFSKDSLFAGEKPTFEYSPLTAYPAAEFVLLTEGLAVDSHYGIRFDRRLLYPGIADSLAYAFGSFNASFSPDLGGPTLVALEPPNGAQNVSPNMSIAARFSEPVRMQNSASALWLSGDSDTLPLTIMQPDAFAIAASPTAQLNFGSRYSLHINGADIIDRAGNTLGDSTDIYTFSTIGRDTLGQVSGGIQYTDSDETGYSVLINFIPLKGGTIKTLRLDRGQIEYSTDLLPGYYSVSGFIDRDKDGALQYGSIIPYTLAEPFSASTDSIRVRSRFVTKDIVIEF